MNEVATSRIDRTKIRHDLGNVIANFNTIKTLFFNEASARDLKKYEPPFDELIAMLNEIRNEFRKEPESVSSSSEVTGE